MEKNEGQEGSDLFQEIQEKVDQEMFLDPEEPDAEGTSAPHSAMDETSMNASEAAEFEVVIDVIDPDAAETEVDDAFLEEVDYLPLESVTEEVNSLETPPLEEVALTDLPPQEVSPTATEEAFVQEDDLFLGELIGREMVGTEETEGADEGTTLAASSEEDAGAGEGDEDVLNTRTLADLYADQGHYDQAVEIYEGLVRHHPEDDGLHAKLEELREKELAASIGIPAAASGVEAREELSGEVKTELIQRLESWLAQIQAEKERRCLRNS